jgi:hypothetical protein
MEDVGRIHGSFRAEEVFWDAGTAHVVRAPFFSITTMTAAFYFQDVLSPCRCMLGCHFPHCRPPLFAGTPVFARREPAVAAITIFDFCRHILSFTVVIILPPEPNRDSHFSSPS